MPSTSIGASPDHRSLTHPAPLSDSDPIRASPTRPRQWSHRPKSPRVVIPTRRHRDLSKMARHHNKTLGSLHSKSPHKKRKGRGLPQTPVLRREQALREAKPVPSIEESAQKGPFDPYAFLSLPPTPSLPSPSPNKSTQVATENAKPTLSSNPRPPASNDTLNEVKREESIPFTPLIRHTTVAPSLQNTQIRRRKLEENGLVELDRDEYALQRFMKVQGEMSDLEEILMKGKKKHVFEQIKRNAETKSLRGAERKMADNDATPTPSARPTTLRQSESLIDERNPHVASKVVETRTEISKGGPASTRDAPSTSIPGKDKTGKLQEEYRSHSEGSKSQDKSQDAPSSKPPKRKELPGLGIIFNPRPNLPKDNRKRQDRKLPRDLQRREVIMPEGKDSVDAANDIDVEGAIDSAQDWLQRENASYQGARQKRWQADPNWKNLTPDQIDIMRRQGSIPPAKFYGHPHRWRAPTGWRQPPVIEKPIFTVAKADQILARLKEDRVLLEHHTKDKETDLLHAKYPRSKDEKETNKPFQEKVQSSTSDENRHPPTNGTANSSKIKAKSTSSGEEKEVNKAIGHEVDSQRSTKDGKPTVESRVKDLRDTARPSKVKTPSQKRKRDTEVSETATKASTTKIVPESPELPSMQEIMEKSQMAATSSPSQKKKSKKLSRTEAIEDVVNDAPEPSTLSKSKKRKKTKETIEEQEVARDEASTTTQKRKKAAKPQESNAAVQEKARPETFIERLKRLKREEKARALQEAWEPSQPTIPAPEAATTNNLDGTSPNVQEPTVDDEWQPTVDDEDPPSPQPSPPKRKKHKSKHDHQTDTSPATAVDDTTPETIEPTAEASPPIQPARTMFNQHRRRHQSLPPPNTTTATTPTANPNNPAPQSPQTPLDVTILSIRTRLANLEAAIANPPPALPNNPATLTTTALLKLRKPPLPRAVPLGSTQLTDAELIQVGKNKSGYERHTAAPYAFSWRGGLYAAFDYLLDWVDERGVGGWDCKVKSRLKHH